MTRGIEAIERMVDTATSFETYAESQSYFSANIVADVAAGVAAIIIITRYTVSLIGSPIRRKSKSKNTVIMGRMK